MNELEKDCWKLFRRMGAAYSLPDVMTKAMAVMYMQPEDIAMDDVARKTGYSLASISNTVKKLEAIGIVQKRRKPGSKKLFLYMEKNLAKLNLQKIRAARDNYIVPTKNMLPDIIKKHKKNPENKEQLKLLEDYAKQLDVFEKLMDKWKKDLETASGEISRKIN